MTLNAGERLGGYEILAPIGAGGMGEVYKAHDTKLGRDVAVKVLPEAVSQDRERLARFEREARLLASLNHPNIATIHGLEEFKGRHFLVLELVPGETLAERIERGAMTVDEALPLFTQTAEALEAAHEKGIVHRDLKPANIKVTPEGRVKVLDFGLAKAFAGEDRETDLSQSPTLTRNTTEAGVILGTAPYMSPEQARGKTVDKRADIWALGCCLYEALAGRPAFLGETVTDTIAKVVEREPDWEALPACTPPGIRALLGRCLRKDPERRFRDVWDVRVELDEALATSAGRGLDSVERAPALRERTISYRTAALVATLAALAVGVVTWSLIRSGVPDPLLLQSLSRVVVSLPPDEHLVLGNEPNVAVSPDGAHLAYAAESNGHIQLYLRAMNEFEARPLPGTDGATEPFFSPDGRWVGFFAGTRLQKVPVAGGAPLTICDSSLISAPRGATWGSDDTIIFTPVTWGGLWRISASGGTPEALTTPDAEKGELGHRWPQILPDGKNVLSAIRTSDGLHLAVLSLETVEWRSLRGSSELRGLARYVPTGHLIGAGPGGLLAVPFDPERVEVTGSAVPVVSGVYSPRPGYPHFAVSETGTLVYVPGRGDSTLVWVDHEGRAEPLTEDRGNYRWLRLSPDGRRVALGVGTETGTYHIWIYDIERGTRSRLTVEAGTQNPIWTPDGKRIAFRAQRGLCWKPADGSGETQLLLATDNPSYPYSWSPDGQALVFTEQQDIWILRRGGDVEPSPFLTTSSRENQPTLSPDGRWLAYISNESGRYEVYVQPYPGPGARLQVSTDGGETPLWSADGRELFYRNGGQMLAVSVAPGPSFSAGKPRLLFEGRYDTDYDVSPDGQRFLMIRSEEESAGKTELRVVLNWFEELKRRVPRDSS